MSTIDNTGQRELDAVVDALELSPMTPSELFKVAELMRNQDELAHGLANPAASVEERVAVVQALFTERLTAETVAVLSAVASRDWSNERAMLAAIDRQAVRTQLKLSQVALARRTSSMTDVDAELLSGVGEIATSLKERTLARVTVARALTDEQTDRLRSELARIYGKDVDLDVQIDPRVLGGVRVEVEGELIDGTVLSRLEEASRQLNRVTLLPQRQEA